MLRCTAQQRRPERMIDAVERAVRTALEAYSVKVSAFAPTAPVSPCGPPGVADGSDR
jgi:hypothetical protein